MPELDIPEQDRTGIVILRDMPDEALNALINALQQPSDTPPTIKGVQPSDVQLARDALDTMYHVRLGVEVPIDEFISDVFNSLREQNQLSGGQEPRLRERLRRLLDIEPLTVAAKAVLLQMEHEHKFCTCRILTDARPVFATDVSKTPPAVIINHSLKISYHERSRVKDIYVALTPNDLTELRNALDRAGKKEDSLRSIFAGTGVQVVGEPRD